MDISVTQKTPEAAAKKQAVILRFTTEQTSRWDVAGGTPVLVTGMGTEKPEQRLMLRHLRAAIRTAKSAMFSHIVIDLSELDAFRDAELTPDTQHFAARIAQHALTAEYDFTTYKTAEKKEMPRIRSLTISNVANTRAIREGVQNGQAIAEAVNATRELANTPASTLTPRKLAEHARKESRGTGIKVNVLDTAAMRKEKMGAVLAVAQGSTNPPQFITLDYTPKNASKQVRDNPVVIIGKGVTFDTGGINLKPSDSIADMYLDMAGGAAAIHTAVAAAKQKLGVRVIALIPAVENMPSGSSFRPGDILTTMAGKTVEVNNTDAEGRLIMADALTYAERFHPALTIDVATLTGAALVAFGQYAAPYVTPDTELQKTLQRIGDQASETIWPMPLFEEYEGRIKGQNADLANVPSSSPRLGGTLTAAAFLYQFAKTHPAWLHIDIAPRTAAADDEGLAPGATGAPVPLLLQLLREYIPR